MSETKNITNIAVIGSGYWGKNLIRNFNELGVLHTICDCDKKTLKNFQQPRKDLHKAGDAPNR